MVSHGTVFLVDDDEALRRATTRMLTASGFEVRGFASAEEYLAGLDAAAAGCLLLDLRLPGRSGLELQRLLLERGCRLPIVFLTGHADVPASVYAMKQGAVDFLEKPARGEELIAALQRALALDAEQRRIDAELQILRGRYAKLSEREKQVLAELLAGARNKQAAFALGIAERTVKLHRSRVLKKMGTDSIPELVRMAERLGLPH
jgi:FixJ family two-component response regulator